MLTLKCEMGGKGKNRDQNSQKNEGKGPSMTKVGAFFLMVFFFLLSFTQQIPRFRPYLGSKPKGVFYENQTKNTSIVATPTHCNLKTTKSKLCKNNKNTTTFCTQLLCKT
jgi:hypothetical protein